jgi:hypothetical protein
VRVPVVCAGAVPVGRVGPDRRLPARAGLSRLARHGGAVRRAPASDADIGAAAECC